MIGRHLRICRAQIPTLVLFVAFHCLFPAKGDSSIRLLKQTLMSTNYSFTEYVVPGYNFSPSDFSKYICKHPCFADVEKAMKRHLSMQEILANIRGKLNLHPSSPDPAAIPAPGSAASSSQPVTPHLRNVRFLSVVRLLPVHRNLVSFSVAPSIFFDQNYHDF